jgi:IS5 family transposase
VGLNLDEPVWDVTVFTKNRERLVKAEVSKTFFDQVVLQAQARDLMSDDHFTVDGTLLEACASLKSFKKIDAEPAPPPEDPGNPTVNFHGEKRSNQTHQSTTDPEAKLARKGSGKEAKMSYSGHVLMENRNGLVVKAEVLAATGTAEKEAALAMIEQIPGEHPVTVGADKAYDTKEFVAEARALNATPHVAQNNTRRKSAIDGRTTRHPGYGVSQQKRKRVEEIFGWMKTVGGMRKLRHRGVELVGWMFTMTAAAYNLVRIRNLVSATPIGVAKG